MIAMYCHRIRLFAEIVAHRCKRGRKPEIREAWRAVCWLGYFESEIERIYKKYHKWQIWTRR